MGVFYTFFFTSEKKRNPTLPPLTRAEPRGTTPDKVGHARNQGGQFRNPVRYVLVRGGRGRLGAGRGLGPGGWGGACGLSWACGGGRQTGYQPRGQMATQEHTTLLTQSWNYLVLLLPFPFLRGSPPPFLGGRPLCSHRLSDPYCSLLPSTFSTFRRLASGSWCSPCWGCQLEVGLAFLRVCTSWIRFSLI